MTWRSALKFLESRERFGIRLGTANIERLLSRMGDPHKKIPCIHVAGSNGKGSTCRLISGILEKHGRRTGLYLSPHLLDIRERIQVGNRPVSRPEFTALLEEIAPLVEEQSEFEPHSLTYFEVLTAMAFLCFCRKKVDLAVIETGMGGRYDATNVVDPLVSVITPIGLDHRRYLGNTLPLVASEKAGIIKRGRPVVCAPQRPAALKVLRKTAREKGSPFSLVGRNAFYRVNAGQETGAGFEVTLAGGPAGPENVFPRLRLSLPGNYQAQNTATACLALRSAGIEMEPARVRNALASITWPGRLQELSARPLVVFDVSHNRPAIGTMLENLGQIYPKKQLYFVFGVLRDKDYSGMLRLLGPRGKGFYFTRPDSPRARDPEELATAFRRLFPACGTCESIPSPGEAVSRALAGPAGADGALLCVCGSFYLAPVISLFSGGSRQKPTPAGKKSN